MTLFRGPRVVMWIGLDGRWYFHQKAGNGRIVKEGKQSYKHKRSAVRAARRDMPGLPIQLFRIRRK